MSRNFQSAVLLLIFLAVSFFAGATEYRVVINSGHNQAVTFLQYDESRNLLYSGSNDGTLRIWNPLTGELKYNQSLSRSPLRLVALNPARPEAAVVSSDTLNSFVLTFWNWETGEKLFSRNLKELPLFIKYSPQGNFLVYGVANWDSLSFIDSAGGAVLPYLTQGFGIVSSVFISASEKTILTYSPSGYIQYWDVETGALKQRIATLPNLEKITFTPSGRYMAASNKRELLYIDLLSGSAGDKRNLADVEFLSYTSETGQLVCYSKSNGGYLLSLFDTNRNTLFPVSSYANLSIRGTSALASGRNTVYLATADGTLNQFDTRSEILKVFSQSQILNISDAAASGRDLLITAENKIFAFDSRFLRSPGETQFHSRAIRTFDLPFTGRAGLSWYKDNLYLVWATDASSGNLSLFSPNTGILKSYTDYPYSFSDVSFRENRVVTLDRNGECRVLDLDTDETVFQFSSFGLKTISFTRDGNLLAGRNQSSGVTSPLLHINTTTSETVPVNDDSLVISRLVHEPSTGAVYSLGVEERRNRLRTVLKRHSGDDYTQAETLLTSLGENPSAHLYIEDDGTRIYTSLGTQGVKMLYWGGFTPFEPGTGNPGKLIVMEDYLLSLNSDNSISFWGKTTGELDFTLYLFKDLNWILLFPQGRYMTSGDAEKYIRIFEGNSTKLIDSRTLRISQ